MRKAIRQVKSTNSAGPRNAASHKTRPASDNRKSVAGRLSGLGLCLALCLVGPPVAGAKKFTILTEPVTDGRVHVDDKFVGVAPVTLDIKVRNKRPAEITVEKEGAMMEESQLVTSAQSDRIVVRLVPTHKKYTVVTEPVVDGRVEVNGEFVGIAPVTVNLSVTSSEPVLITAERSEAVSRWPRQVTPSVSDTDSTIVVRLERDRAIVDTIECNTCNEWVNVTPRRTLSDSDRTWQKLISLITNSFPDLQQVDRISFYIRSAWRVREYPFDIVRHRLVIKRGLGDDFTLRLLLESEKAVPRGNGYRDEDFRSWNRQFPVDQEMLQYLRDQL